MHEMKINHITYFQPKPGIRNKIRMGQTMLSVIVFWKTKWGKIQYSPSKLKGIYFDIFNYSIGISFLFPEMHKTR